MQDELEGWDTIELPPITPKIRRRDLEQAWGTGVPSNVPVDWDAPLAIPEPLPVVRRPGWISPEYDAEGNQLCTRFYPCRKRECQRCEDRKTHRKAKQLSKRMEGRRCFLITLTQRHGFDSVAKQRSQMMGKFKSLRRPARWKRSVLGGYYAIQFGNQSQDDFNCHLHIIAEMSEAVSYEEFNNCLDWEWTELGGGYVDVQEIRDTYKSRLSVTHYCTRGVLRQFGGKVNEQVEEVWKGNYRLPKGNTFGSWRGQGQAVSSPAIVEQPVEEERVVQEDHRGTVQVQNRVWIIDTTNEQISASDRGSLSGTTAISIRVEVSDRDMYNQDSVGFRASCENPPLHTPEMSRRKARITTRINNNLTINNKRGSL